VFLGRQARYISEVVANALVSLLQFVVSCATRKLGYPKCWHVSLQS
jgi:hypothetical protein